MDLASLMHQKSRLVRGGARRAAFEAALAGRAGVQLEVVSARQRGRSGSGRCIVGIRVVYIAWGWDNEGACRS